MNLQLSNELLHRNQQVIPGGLASINRKADPCIAFARALGSRMWDVDGNEYIDYHAGFAPYILGHNDPDQNKAVIDAMTQLRSNYGSGPTSDEGELARLFLSCVPSAERVQFLNTGSEATAQAIRVARAWTGNDHVLRMQGSYNGNHNMVASNVMSTKEQLGGRQIIGDEYPLAPLTAGIPGAERTLMHSVEFNNLEAVENVARRYKLAALITEPVLQNVGIIKPRPGYLEGLRRLADQYGFLLILDEVKTGFRSVPGPYHAARGIDPDLSTYGKAIANGFPIAALAGKARFMDLVTSADPHKRVLIAGTYNCHPVPVAAAIACLRKLTDPALNVYAKLESLSTRLELGVRRLMVDHNVTATFVRQGSAHCTYFMPTAPANWWEALSCHDFAFDTRYRRALIERGIYQFPVAAKQGSISFAHSEADIDQTLEATDSALTELQQSPLRVGV
ncbi:MAG: aspartate aminotransferase family protein [Phycisphaeraceae bacterium]|nr:aspartate aminotransferase family protein [Phycisphaeraceae bacterium]